mmetsp:Transcript_34936/g.92530  ORF Transcript_34936/g.92530 Transcript_34936/m.92530 type:complete len:257 (+) Transcript_34936:690-1460(+)
MQALPSIPSMRTAPWAIERRAAVATLSARVGPLSASRGASLAAQASSCCASRCRVLAPTDASSCFSLPTESLSAFSSCLSLPADALSAFRSFSNFERRFFSASSSCCLRPALSLAAFRSLAASLPLLSSLSRSSLWAFRRRSSISTFFSSTATFIFSAATLPCIASHMSPAPSATSSAWCRQSCRMAAAGKVQPCGLPGWPPCPTPCWPGWRVLSNKSRMPCALPSRWADAGCPRTARRASNLIEAAGGACAFILP